MTPAGGRIGINRLLYVRYQHVDPIATKTFFLDFGLDVVEETITAVYYRGFGQDHVCYVSEKSQDGQTHFIGGGWAIDSYDDLERAAQLPGASPIVDAEPQIGGKMVELKDPLGTSVFVHWGHHKRAASEIEKPKKLIYNTWDEKNRKGEFQRFANGPANVHKLGHYGLEVNASDFDRTLKWYLDTFTLAATDSVYNNVDGKDIMTFVHLDRGEEFVDHHSFFLAAGRAESGSQAHHSSFEVDDFDSELKGHVWLQEQGYQLVWGVGRHRLGSQIFDYWYDPNDFVVEHYADGDLVNSHHKMQRVEASPEAVTIWGPTPPIDFGDRKHKQKSGTV